MIDGPTEAILDASRWFHRVLGARQYTIAGGTSEIQRRARTRTAQRLREDRCGWTIRICRRCRKFMTAGRAGPKPGSAAIAAQPPASGKAKPQAAASGLRHAGAKPPD